MMNNETRFYKETLKTILPDMEQTRKNILASVPKKAKRKRYVPLIACACAALVICVAVPPVRAAIALLFQGMYGVNEHMAIPAEERPYVPEVDDVIKATMVEPTDELPAAKAEITSIDPEWKEWADGLDPQVGDILFDGEQLIVTCDMGADGSNFLLDGGVETTFGIWMNYEVTMQPEYIMLNGEKYYAGGRVQPVGDWFDPGAMERGEALPDKNAVYSIVLNFKEASEIYEHNKALEGRMDGHEKDPAYQQWVEAAKKHDPDYTPEDFKAPPAQMTGVQQAVMNIPILATDSPGQFEEQEGGIAVDPRQIGVLTLKFSFDPAAGYERNKTNERNETVTFSGTGIYDVQDFEADPDPNKYVYSQHEIDYTGVTMSLKESKTSPTGTEITVVIDCPDDWDKDTIRNFTSNLQLEITADGAEYEYSAGGGPVEDGSADYECTFYLSMMESEAKMVKEFKITPSLSHITVLDGQKLVPDKEYAVGLNVEINDFEIEPIESGVLTFSLG